MTNNEILHYESFLATETNACTLYALLLSLGCQLLNAFKFTEMWKNDFCEL